VVERKVSIVGDKLHIIGGRKGRRRATDQTLSPGALLIFKPLFTRCQIHLGIVQKETKPTNQKTYKYMDSRQGKGKDDSPTSSE